MHITPKSWCSPILQNTSSTRMSACFQTSSTNMPKPISHYILVSVESLRSNFDIYRDSIPHDSKFKPEIKNVI